MKMTETSDTFCFSSSAGGPETAHMYVHLQRLHQLFKHLKDVRYSKELDWFGAFVYIDGSLCSWEIDGVGKLVLYRRSRYIMGDVGVPVSRWQGLEPLDVRRYYAASFRLLYERMAAKIRGANLDFDAERFADDTRSVLEEYESDPEPYPVPSLQAQVEESIRILRSNSQE